MPPISLIVRRNRKGCFALIFLLSHWLALLHWHPCPPVHPIAATESPTSYPLLYSSTGCPYDPLRHTTAVSGIS
ncbi:hypothetical protein BJ138DRAFT_1156233 [Hygrophoropsis aurantiaca]|uniref:Uncharacterized protein n=1 Tax=Hygrophoropsis aurantiaca TaxID=72124 RepID=A0ACB8A7R2_9AGAM|nr:hypothetical protein BJ138DRAFT_1156233 [Hygrophoropsis aurantiaca]